MTKKILLLTAGHLSSCPRLIKEAELLEKSGYQVAIVFLVSIESIYIQDKQIIEAHPSWEYHPIYWIGNKSNKTDVLKSKLYYQFCNKLTLSSPYIQSTSKLLIDTIINIKADLYIAHHPSVLVAAAKAAEKYQSKYTYDIEDAFPYVEDERFENNPNKLILDIERKYIKNAVLISAASPLYIDLYTKNYPGIVEPIRLLNVFDVVDNEVIEYKDRKDGSKISLYWVSQTIGLNRGLNDLLKAINSLPINSIELHLRGNVTEEVKRQLLSEVSDKRNLENIFFHDTVSVDELMRRNKEHDIGFALEANLSLNRGMSISNKILDYIRSGLMIAATSTEGHKYVVEDFEGEAILYNAGDVQSLTQQLLEYINNPSKIDAAKQKSRLLAKTKYNWSLESKQWLEKINAILK